MSAPPQVLALRPLALGDLLTAIPALRALRRHYTGHQVVLAAAPVLRDVVRHAAAADDVLPAVALQPIRTHTRPDVAVDLHGRGPESHRVLLQLAPRRLVAFHNAAIPATADIEPPHTALGAAHHGSAVIHPGAAFAARRWPVQRFIEVARACARRGLRVVVTGGRDERVLARQVAGATPGAVSAAGRTTILELIDLIGNARIVVSGDTSVAHMATATGCASVTLFGPTPPSLWGPPAGMRQHRVLWAGRSGDPRGAAPDPGLLAIGADAVIAAVHETLDHTASPRVAAGSVP